MTLQRQFVSSTKIKNGQWFIQTRLSCQSAKFTPIRNAQFLLFIYIYLRQSEKNTLFFVRTHNYKLELFDSYKIFDQIDLHLKKIFLTFSLPF